MNALAIVFTPDRQRIFVSILLNFLTFQSHFTTVGTFTDTSASSAEICFTHRRLFIPGPGNFTLLILWFHFVHESRTNRNSYTKINPEAMSSTSCGKFQEQRNGVTRDVALSCRASSTLCAVLFIANNAFTTSRGVSGTDSVGGHFGAKQNHV